MTFKTLVIATSLALGAYGCDEDTPVEQEESVAGSEANDEGEAREGRRGEGRRGEGRRGEGRRGEGRGGEGRGGEGRGDRTEDRADRRLEHLTEQLSLTPEQATQIRTILEQASSERDADQEDRQAAREATNASIREVLTAEQQAQFDAMPDRGEGASMRGEGRGEGRGMRGPRGEGGMRGEGEL